ncbi:MAG: bifunctional demethylmenaquinone methyltransferase/2-methoxy-6-polyprenyl-1,4-benzoquinol methylase UbiE [Gammaproteobacteria bacterium]|nr:bifunctional demethylmenaquinone methyltransferase/2-methoxy-6-polyprenyl-1,4-benzoquinol methylase UbiE [Gammaproteobacteria bacterium]
MSTTDFGFEKVPEEDKVRRVAQVFDSVATRYDLMNDLMSFGLHRLWKRFAVDVSGVHEGERILDLAGGTGDVAALLAGRVGRKGSVVVADINPSMLGVGRERLDGRGLVGNVTYAQANAERLPFAEGSFDCVTMAFGLRNVTHKEAALAETLRVLRPGGRLLVLEFSHVTVSALRPLYDLYSLHGLPLMGRLVAGDADSYRYLAESIRMHPDQETLKGMMETAGFVHCDYLNHTGGIVAVHRGWKP